MESSIKDLENNIKKLTRELENNIGQLVKDFINEHSAEYGPDMLYSQEISCKPLADYCHKIYVHNLIYLFRKYNKGKLPVHSLIFLDKTFDINDKDYTYNCVYKGQDIYHISKTNILTGQKEIIILKGMTGITYGNYDYMVLEFKILNE